MHHIEIESVRLTDKQKAYCLEKIDKINLTIQKWAQVFSVLKTRAFRNMILRDQTSSLPIPQERLSEFQEDASLIRSVQSPDINLDGRSIQDAILQNYSLLAKKHAITIHKNNQNKLQYNDFLQECYMQVIESMFSWFADHGADLTTYIYNSLKNRLINVVNQQCMTLSHMTNQSLSLLSKFNKAMEILPQHLNTQEIIESMQLSELEKSHLIDIVKNRFFKSTNTIVSVNESQGHRHIPFGEPIAPISESENEVKFIEEKEYIQQILEKSHLTPIEHELMTKSIFEKDWRKEFAQRICPQTQKPFGYHKIAAILRKAGQKVAIAYRRLND